ncbi:MAG: AAA family ATPase [Meiothermus sp.]|nr:AAA family ATPase [Meiothermus sp.]
MEGQENTNSLPNPDYTTLDKMEARLLPGEIVEGFMRQGWPYIWFGQPGASKSLHALMCALCLSLGLDFAGMRVKRRYRVLYLDYESGQDFVEPYLAAMLRGLGARERPGEFAYWSPFNFDRELQPLDLANGDWASNMVPRIAKMAMQHRAEVVFLDSLGLYSGADPLKIDVAKDLQALNVLRHKLLGCALVAIDHSTKDQSGRLTPYGSQFKRSWARGSYAMEGDGLGQVRWSVDKINGIPFAPFTTRLVFQNGEGRSPEVIRLEVGDSASPSPGQLPAPRGETALQRNMRLVLERLTKSGATWSQLQEVVGGSAQSLSRALDGLGNRVAKEQDPSSRKVTYKLLPTSTSLKDGSLGSVEPHLGGVPLPNQLPRKKSLEVQGDNSVPVQTSGLPAHTSNTEADQSSLEAEVEGGDFYSETESDEGEVVAHGLN